MRYNNPAIVAGRTPKTMLKKVIFSLLITTVLVGLAAAGPLPVQAQSANGTPGATRTSMPLNAQGEGDLLTGVWPRAMVVDTNGDLWVANGFDNSVIRLSGNTGKQIGEPVKVGTQPTALIWLAATNTLWVASYDDASLTPVEFDKNVPVARQAIPLNESRPVGMALSAGNIWIITQVSGALTPKDNLLKFDPASKQIISKLTVGTFPTAIINSASETIPNDRQLFVANGHDDSVSVVDTVANGGKGAITTTITEGVPPFPFSLVFDGATLWVGSYDCVYAQDRCSESTVGRIDMQKVKPIAATSRTAGRQVFIALSIGHVFSATGHGSGYADINAVTADGRLQILQNVPVGKPSYFGALATSKQWIYIADWTNDRVIRKLPPVAIAIPPTPTALPPTAVPPPTTQPTATPPCNPDPDFPPRLSVGSVGRVVDDKFIKPLNIRKDPNFLSDSLTGKQFLLGDEFTVLEGPAANNKPLDDKKNPDASCFYRVEGLKDKTFAGWITEGGLQKTDGKDKRYYIEPKK